MMLKNMQELRGKVVFWDVVRVLAPWYTSTAARFSKDMPPSEFVLRMMQYADNSYHCSLSTHEDAICASGMLTWLREHYPAVEAFGVLQKPTEDISQLVKSFCNTAGLEEAIFILANEDRVNQMREEGFVCYTLSEVEDCYNRQYNNDPSVTEARIHNILMSHVVLSADEKRVIYANPKAIKALTSELMQALFDREDN